MEAETVFGTCWPDLYSSLVGSSRSRSRLVALRRSAFEAWGAKVPPEALEDRWDGAPGTDAYLLWKGGRAVGSVRTSLNHLGGTWRETPGCHFFPREIRSLFRSHRCLEATRLVTIPDRSPGSRWRLFALFQNVTAAADREHCRYILAPSRADHTRFYLAIGFEAVTSERIVPT